MCKLRVDPHLNMNSIKAGVYYRLKPIKLQIIKRDIRLQALLFYFEELKAFFIFRNEIYLLMLFLHKTFYEKLLIKSLKLSKQ